MHKGRWLMLLAVAILAIGLGYLAFEARVAREFAALDSSSPARILARPWTLRVGDRVDPQRLLDHLKRVGYRPVSGRTPQTGEFSTRGRDLIVGRRALRLGGLVDSGVRARVSFRSHGRIYSIRNAEGDRLAQLLLDPEVIGDVPRRA